MAMALALRRLSSSAEKPIQRLINGGSLYYMSSLPNEAVYEKEKCRVSVKHWPKQLNSPLEVVDPEIANIIELEKARQWKERFLTMVRSTGYGAQYCGLITATGFATLTVAMPALRYQKEMLCDRVRMEAYYNAVFENKHHFHGKTVLDVGTGSGILAIWAGQAGARKVYAVEATKMSEHALSGLTRLVG
ncbi:hypothetical protein HYC85_005582 [Camellia sinensis]|uniref:Uncharacterized protein n=1 Tax=Camellia sinensis TaxID=4442 RepID=A0A7J7I138_CAMSI|nr:hypothetical protein HYC85_005582 [Camellia sinensis]